MPLAAREVACHLSGSRPAWNLDLSMSALALPAVFAPWHQNPFAEVEPAEPTPPEWRGRHLDAREAERCPPAPSPEPHQRIASRSKNQLCFDVPRLGAHTRSEAWSLPGAASGSSGRL